MKIFTLLLLLFSIPISGCFAQNNPKPQPILELTTLDLQNIGVIIKGNQIIINNEIPGMAESYSIIIDEAGYNPKIKDDLKIPKTNFDFYPYYITRMDSISGYMQKTDEENELKSDPLFQRKMFNYLVPVKITRNDFPGIWGKELLFWFTPTESFHRILSNKYQINREYVPDTLVTSDIALPVTDEELKRIGFEIKDEEIYFETYVHKSPFSSDSKPYLVFWYNDKKESGTGTISGNISNEKKKYPDYYIVKVVFTDGKINFDMNYKGRAVPIYIRNSNRNYSEKKDVIIYLKYTPKLIEDLHSFYWWRMPDRYTVIMK